jgi:hypothetical protein
MPFDPNLPQENTLADAAQMRAQLNGLKTLIDNGSGITSAVVDTVTVVAPGQPAIVTLSVVGTVLHVSLALPQGYDGAPGAPGVQGPPFANVVIDSITTLDPGTNASVTVYFDGTLVHLSFAIPRGMQGEQGIQGAPGEVTNAAMTSAISSAITDTARNPIGIAPFTGTFSDPVTPAEMQAFAAYVESFRAALVR